MTIRTIDMHTGGEPLRVVVEGFPELEGTTVIEKRRYCRNHYDHLRKSLMWEPRGHADMYGCLITEPNDEGAAFGVIFMHNEGYSTMCGHATIALGKLAVELGWVPATEPITEFYIDAPCGRLKIKSTCADQTVSLVHFECVPSFVLLKNHQIEVREVGKVTFDIAYGGAFYAFVNSNRLGLELIPQNYTRIIHHGKAIKEAIIRSGLPIDHPMQSDLSFLYGTIFIGGPVSEGIDSRNVCVFADGEVDRCPTGSGVSARMAIHHERGEIKIGETMLIESIIGSVFTGEVLRSTTFGPYQAVVPGVSGQAFITGQNEWIIDPEDPWKDGFFLR